MGAAVIDAPVFAAMQNALVAVFGFFALWWLAAFLAACFGLALAILWQAFLRRLSSH